MKRFLSMILVVVMLSVPMLSMSTYASSNYDANAAMDYAVAHWDDGIGKCATFVSNCLKAGGCGAWSSTCSGLLKALQDGKYGSLYKLESSDHIYQEKNRGVLSAGDPVFWYQGGGYPHVVICSGFDSKGRMLYYAHNNAANNKLLYADTAYVYDSNKNKVGIDAYYSFHMDISSQNVNTTLVSNSVKDGTYYIVSALNGEKSALSVEGDSTKSKANIHLWTRHTGDSEKFKITKNGSYYTITNIKSGMALDVYDASTKSGANVWQYTPNNTKAQQWTFEDAGNGYVYIKSALGNYLDVDDADTNNGTNIQVYKGNKTIAQKWKLVPAYYLNVNGIVDGKSKSTLNGFATVDVYINGQCVANDVADYYMMIASDATYEIKDIKIADGYEFSGSNVILAGNVGKADKNIEIYITKKHSHSHETKYESSHPHKQYKICDCGDKYYTGNTKNVDGCNDCHEHSYATKYESSHPHKQYKVCDCGDKYYTGNTKTVDSCTTCNPPEIPKPGKSNLIINKTSFETGENIVCSWTDVKNGDYFEFFIIDADKNERYYVNWGIEGTSNTISVEDPGKYYAYVAAINRDIIDLGSDYYATPSNYVYIEVEEHTHSYSIKNESTHPHKQYKVCDCGDKYYTGNTKTVDSCTTCNPPKEECYHYDKSYYYENKHPHKQYSLCDDCGEKEYTGKTKKVDSCTQCYPEEEEEITYNYTLYYDGNGGIEPPSPVTITSGSKVKTTNEKMSRDGYEFLGWAKTKRATAPDYTGGETITLTKDTTLYAVWEEAESSVRLVLTIDSAKAFYNGTAIYNDVAPIIENGRTMLPARFIAENLGASVTWHEGMKKVIIKNDSTTIEITIGSSTAFVNGTKYQLDSPAFISNSRTYTPVRFICEALGASVEWDAKTRQVIIIK